MYEKHDMLVTKILTCIFSVVFTPAPMLQSIVHNQFLSWRTAKEFVIKLLVLDVLPYSWMCT